MIARWVKVHDAEGAWAIAAGAGGSVEDAVAVAVGRAERAVPGFVAVRAHVLAGHR